MSDNKKIIQDSIGEWELPDGKGDTLKPDKEEAVKTEQATVDTAVDEMENEDPFVFDDTEDDEDDGDDDGGDGNGIGARILLLLLTIAVIGCIVGLIWLQNSKKDPDTRSTTEATETTPAVTTEPMTAAPMTTEAIVPITPAETTPESTEDSTDENIPVETMPIETTADPEETTPEETTADPDGMNDEARKTVWDNYPNLGVISAPNYLNIRTTPSISGQIVGILYNMSGVDLLDVSEDGNWYHIISNNIEGYINAEFVVTGDEAKKLAYEHAFPAVMVLADVLNVRKEPNTDSAMITQIISNTLYPVAEETNGEWLKISISSDMQGYVHRDFVKYEYVLQDAIAYTPAPQITAPTVNPVRVQIVNTALKYLGGTYVWGGTELGVGVDCSGFMLRIFEQFGYKLQRTSYWQVNQGVPVSFEEMKPGDLVFYWNYETNRVGHVAMYMGDNQIVHAASERRGIVIDDYRFMTPYCARNIIGE